MPGREPSSEDRGPDNAQEVYSVYLRNLQKGEEVSFEEFCARNSHSGSSRASSRDTRVPSCRWLHHRMAARSTR